MERYGATRRGTVWYGKVRQVRWDKVGHGEIRQVWPSKESSVLVRRGLVRQAGLGGARWS